jgi:hypothetical protein
MGSPEGANRSSLPGGGHVDSDTFGSLMMPHKGQAEAVADVLRGLGAYTGSKDDALTDAAAVVLAMRYAPEGDNHHNARQCPYCNPSANDDRSTDG